MNITKTNEGGILMSPEMFSLVMEMAQPSHGNVSVLINDTLENLTEMLQSANTVEQVASIFQDMNNFVQLRNELTNFIQKPEIDTPQQRMDKEFAEMYNQD